MPDARPAFAPVTPHIHRIELPFLDPVAAWLVRHAGGWTLVDAGTPKTQDVLIEQVLAHTGGERPVRLILTHGHLDHAAAAPRLRDEWRVPIAAGSAEIPYLLGPARYGQIPSRNPLYRLLQASPPPLIGRNVHYPLYDGAVIDGMTVVEAPGHAPGMIALLHPEDRALICGDAFVYHGGRLGDPGRFFTYDMGLNHRSQARLAALDFDHLLVSHGAPVLGDGAAKAGALVASRKR